MADKRSDSSVFSACPPTTDSLLSCWLCRFNPAVTSAPLMTTVVDSSGLVIYFWIAKWILDI